jgi:hypothetical protein
MDRTRIWGQVHVSHLQGQEADDVAVYFVVSILLRHINLYLEGTELKGTSVQASD